LEKLGVTSVTISTKLFEKLGQVEKRSLGMNELPVAICQHPIGGIGDTQINSRAEELIEQVLAGFIR
tara:strand:- start:2269 stop:2469 length:201 start_codon:yes stop_codon:yes gene_type:complete